MLKRCFDMLLSLSGLAIFAPFLIVIALLVKIEDKGPIFYKGIRMGKNNKLFRMIKFRTMVVNADRIGGHSTADDDCRITKVGKILRRYKLDELPQLINVLRQEMSIVGPRPEVPFYVNMFTEEEKEILSVRPGITDWASLWNWNEGKNLAGSADPEKTYMERIRPEKIRLQLEYVKNNSFLIDLKIIFLTIVNISSNKN